MTAEMIQTPLHFQIRREYCYDTPPLYSEVKGFTLGPSRPCSVTSVEYMLKNIYIDNGTIWFFDGVEHCLAKYGRTDSPVGRQVVAEIRRLAALLVRSNPALNFALSLWQANDVLMPSKNMRVSVVEGGQLLFEVVPD